MFTKSVDSVKGLVEACKNINPIWRSDRTNAARRPITRRVPLSR
jgi:hypothetical protein